MVNVSLVPIFHRIATTNPCSGPNPHRCLHPDGGSAGHPPLPSLAALPTASAGFHPYGAPRRGGGPAPVLTPPPAMAPASVRRCSPGVAVPRGGGRWAVAAGAVLSLLLAGLLAAAGWQRLQLQPLSRMGPPPSPTFDTPQHTRKWLSYPFARFHDVWRVDGIRGVFRSPLDDSSAAPNCSVGRPVYEGERKG